LKEKDTQRRKGREKKRDRKDKAMFSGGNHLSCWKKKRGVVGEHVGQRHKRASTPTRKVRISSVRASEFSKKEEGGKGVYDEEEGGLIDEPIP